MVKNRPITLLLSLAFTFVLALLVGIGLYGMYSLRVIDQHLGLITDQLLKKHTLTMTMRQAARERSLNLHRMILMEDPFERDDEWLAFNANGSVFSQARLELVEMKLSPEEQGILQQQGEKISINVVVQRNVAELAMAGDRDSAADLLSAQALPAQNEVFKHIESLISYYDHSLQYEREQAGLTYHKIVTVGWTAGGMALFAGLLVAIWSVRHIGRGQRVLLAHEKEQSEIINGMMTGVMTISEGGVIESFNCAATTIFGYRSDEIIGKSINILLPESVRKYHDRYLENYFLSEDPSAFMGEREILAMRADASLFPLRIMLSKLPPDKKGVRRVIASCFDITEQKEQEERLRSSQKMDALGKLTGGIAHDYNNMLGVILGYSELLKMKLGDDKQTYSYIHEITQAAERGSQLTKKLLSFTRQKPMEESVVDINALLRDDKMMLERTLTSSVRLEMQLDEALCVTALDVDDLENAVLNLCINARHAMPDGGEIRITTQRIAFDEAQAARSKLPPGEYVRLQIEDSGCGMDAQTQSKVFDPFFTTKGENGTGLGLSQVYGFVKRSGGDISLYSTPGEGTRFELLFPCSNDVVVSTTDVADSVGAGEQVGRGTVLVVDDESALCEMTAEMLSASGYRVLTALGGDQALFILEREQVDLLVSDVIMPQMNGYQLAERVKQRFPRVKIQLMSGYSDNIDTTAADTTLSEYLLPKPFRAEALLSRVRALLN